MKGLLSIGILSFQLAYGELTAGDGTCSRELFIAFYPQPIVSVTLEKYQVPQEDWTTIQEELNDLELDIIPRVEQRAEAMNPNPLTTPDKQQQVVLLFDETVFQAFSSVMEKHGVTDPAVLREMMDDILQQKADRFRSCMDNSAAMT